jgi:hypothetical protein
MTNQEKIILATTDVSKAHFTFITNAELNREFIDLSAKILGNSTYETKAVLFANGTALVNMILNGKI